MNMQEIETRLDRADAAASLALGRTKALEYAVRFLIASHPNPKRAEAGWQKLLVLIADEHLEAPGLPDESMYQAGIQQVLSVLTRQMELLRTRPR